MKEYIKPSIKTRTIETECILAGSIETGISDDPATGPALGKEATFPDNEGSATSSVWDE